MYAINKMNVDGNEFVLIDVVLKDIEVTLMNYGATILSINTKDKNGELGTVVLAYNELESYIKNDPHLNATVGPFAGRINNATFSLNGREYKLDKNHLDTECLHSGSEGLAFKFFDYQVTVTDDHTEVVFTYHKKVLESNFPGNQVFTVVYKVYETTLELNYHVTTDQDTLVNLTNHAYFNLSGNLERNIMDHQVWMNASKGLTLNDKFSPIGIYDLNGNHLDFTTMKKVKDNFFDGIYDLPELGIDNPLMLDEVGLDIKQVEMVDEESGRTLEVYTTYPCVVAYTHNHINDKKLLFDKEHVRHMGICFEMQYEPNGINVPELNDSILRKGEEYNETIIFKFGIKE